MPLLTVIVPAYNEAGGLAQFHQRLRAVLATLELETGILYVDDGSRDTTWAVIQSLAGSDPRTHGLRLSRNFGKEAALTAGLDHAEGEAVVVIDADLQDPPELIPQLVEHWQSGYDVVYATRQARDGETRFKRFTSAAFYRVLEHLSDTPVPRDTGDFRLLSRRAVDTLCGLRERQRFMKGLFAWIGYPQTAVRYRRERRAAGTSKWNYWRLWNLAMEGITSFSTAPLRLATYLGLSTSLLAFVYAAWVFVKAMIWGDPVRGYPTLMVVILFLGGMQLLALGVIGEYLGRLYAEAKQRPLYVVETRAGHDTHAADAGDG